MEKYCRAGQATDDNMAHAHCMLDNLRLQIHFRLCNTHCFSTSTVVTRLHECASVLRYTYIACFFFYIHGGYWLLDESVNWIEVVWFLTTFFRHLLSELKKILTFFLGHIFGVSF